MFKKLILFDLDNTLYNYDQPHKKALKAVYGELKKHFDIKYAKFLRLFDASKREIHRELIGTASSHNRILYFQRLIEKAKHTVEPELILKLYNIYWEILLNNMKLHKDSLKLLKKLKKEGRKIGIVTDLTAHIQLRKLHKLKVSAYIDILVTSEEAGREKPHPSMFLFALNKENILPREAIFVGDNPKTDMEGANAVGIGTVLIMQGKKSKLPKEDYQKPNFIIKDISELSSVLAKIEKKV